MVKKVASAVFLLDSLVIGLGAFGHGLQARHVHAALDPFPIDPNVGSMIYVVWYFVSGCMLAFGATLVWAWRRLRSGDRRPLVAANIIGALYVGIGAFGLIYRSGDPFMAFFVGLGVVLLASGYVLTA
jgi:CHASE2 domain-containing sensor protein